jgi:hypothetical protein
LQFSSRFLVANLNFITQNATNTFLSHPTHSIILICHPESGWHVTSRNQGLFFASRRSKKDPGNEVVVFTCAVVQKSYFLPKTVGSHLKEPYNKWFINLVLLGLYTGKYLPSVYPHRPRSFVARSVRKPQANTFPYRPRSRLITLYHYVYFIMYY